MHNILNFSDFTAEDVAGLTDSERACLEWVVWMFWFNKDEKGDAIRYMREPGDAVPCD